MLSGSNTHTGGTTIAEGTLLIASVGALGGGSLTIHPGASFDSAVPLLLPALSQVWNGSFNFLGSSFLVCRHFSAFHYL